MNGKLILIVLLICSSILIIGCSNHNDEYLSILQKNTQELDKKAERLQERYVLYNQFNTSCIYDTCNEECDVTISVNMMDYDYNDDGEVDAAEYELMNLILDRKLDCVFNCGDYGIGSWKSLTQCRIEGE